MVCALYCNQIRSLRGVDTFFRSLNVLNEGVVGCFFSYCNIYCASYLFFVEKCSMLQRMLDESCDLHESEVVIVKNVSSACFFSFARLTLWINRWTLLDFDYSILCDIPLLSERKTFWTHFYCLVAGCCFVSWRTMMRRERGNGKTIDRSSNELNDVCCLSCQIVVYYVCCFEFIYISLNLTMLYVWNCSPLMIAFESESIDILPFERIPLVTAAVSSIFVLLSSFYRLLKTFLNAAAYSLHKRITFSLSLLIVMSRRLLFVICATTGGGGNCNRVGGKQRRWQTYAAGAVLRNDDAYGE